MKKILLSLFISSIWNLSANTEEYDSFENKKIEKITLNVTNAPPAQTEIREEILQEITLKENDKFSQEEFDKDLKNLSSKYQTVDPVITKKNNELLIHLNLSLRPQITKFIITGSTYSDKKILSKAEIEAPMEFDRSKFYQSVINIRDFLIKRGYFKADVIYEIEEKPGTNEAVAYLKIKQGPLGHINDIKFTGFTKKERSEMYGMIKSSKFNILTNWLIGSGVYKEEEVSHDEMMITQYIHSKGYCDARVNMKIINSTNGKLALDITLDRGSLFHIDNIEISGNELEDTESIKEALSIKSGNAFSEEKIHGNQEKIKNIYSEKGYLDTTVNYKLIQKPDNQYDIVYNIEESEKYNVGLIVVSGNKKTNNNVIYNNISFSPGETLDSDKIKETQRRLLNTGYFKNVNIFADKDSSPTKDEATSKYKNINISLEENRTGAFHVSAGANSTSSIFGEVSISERNFDIEGLSNFWTEGSKAFRGAGQLLDIKAMIAQKEQNASITWVNPYINDSKWSLGSEIKGGKSTVISPDYALYTVGGALNTSYPINSYLSGGMKFRIKNSTISLNNMDAKVELQQEKNSGIVSGAGVFFKYNSTDNPFMPHQGLNSSFDSEFAGLVRDNPSINDFPYLKFAYLNSYYIPVLSKGILKFRADAQFIQPLWMGKSNDLPLTEKFFLGGIGSVRGYAPGQIGSFFSVGDPTGGISSQILSVEYLQKILPPVDAFAFVDSGALSQKPFEIGKFYISTGVGVRLHLGQPMPFVLGWGYPINPDKNPNGGVIDQQIQRVFFSMAGQF